MLAYLGHFQSGKKPFHVRKQQASAGYSFSDDYALDTFASAKEQQRTRSTALAQEQPRQVESSGKSKQKMSRRRRRPQEGSADHQQIWEPKNARAYTGICRFAETNLSLSLKDLDPQRFQSLGGSVSLPRISQHQQQGILDLEESSRKAADRNMLLKTASQVVTKSENSKQATQKFLGYKESEPLPDYNTVELLAEPTPKSEKELQAEKAQRKNEARRKKVRIKQLAAAASDVQEWAPPEDRLLIHLHGELGADWEEIAAKFAEHKEFLFERKPLELCSRFRHLSAAAGRTHRRKQRAPAK
jgi:hypothetical protein